MSYLLKALPIKLVETDALEKIIYDITFTTTKILINWVFTLIVSLEDTNTNINTDYHVQSHKKNPKSTVNMQTTNITSKY